MKAQMFYFTLIVILLLGCESVPVSSEPITSVDPIHNPIAVLDDVDSSPVEGEADGLARIREPGWSQPVKLPVNDEGREDTPYVTRDGRHILFYYDPRAENWDEGHTEFAPTIYYTKRPFVTKEIHPVAGDEINAEIAPYISENGEFYYNRTWIVVEPHPHLAMPARIVKGSGEVLNLGTGQGEGEAHYCDAMDELYAIVDRDRDRDSSDLGVYKNGAFTVLPKPINLPGENDFQPFLTDDCQTLYFTSTRGSPDGSLPLQIYRSKRLGEFKWSKPELFISFPSRTRGGVLGGGVGEFTMTRDGKQIVFLELNIYEGKKRNSYIGQSDIYYAQKIE